MADSGGSMDDYQEWYERTRAAILTRRLKAGIRQSQADINLLNWDKAKGVVLEWALDYLPNELTTKENLQGKQDKGMQALKRIHGKFGLTHYHTHLINGKLYSHPMDRMHVFSDDATRRVHERLIRRRISELFNAEPYRSMGIRRGTIYRYTFKFDNGRLVLRKPQGKRKAGHGRVKHKKAMKATDTA